MAALDLGMSRRSVGSALEMVRRSGESAALRVVRLHMKSTKPGRHISSEDVMG